MVEHKTNFKSQHLTQNTKVHRIRHRFRPKETSKNWLVKMVNAESTCTFQVCLTSQSSFTTFVTPFTHILTWVDIKPFTLQRCSTGTSLSFRVLNHRKIHSPQTHTASRSDQSGAEERAECRESDIKENLGPGSFSGTFYKLEKLKQEGLYVKAAGGKLVLHQQSSFKDQDHKKLHEDGSKGARFSRRSHFGTET